MNDISHVLIRVNPNYREDISVHGPYGQDTAEHIAAQEPDLNAVEVHYPPELEELADLPLDVYADDDMLHTLNDAYIVLLVSTGDIGEQRHAAFGPFTQRDTTLVKNALQAAHPFYNYIAVKVTDIRDN